MKTIIARLLLLSFALGFVSLAIVSQLRQQAAMEVKDIIGFVILVFALSWAIENSNL